MTRRAYASKVIPIVWPDGRWIGYMLKVGAQWFGPFITASGRKLV